MNSPPPDDLINAPEDIPAAIPSLIDAAAAAFDADRDSSRRYLLRASALLRVKRAASTAAESVRRSESRGGLLAWQLNRVIDYIETHLADKITAVDLADLVSVSAGQLFRAFKISVGVTPFHYLARRRVGLAPRDASPDTPSCRIIDVTMLCKWLSHPTMRRLRRHALGSA